MKWKIIVACKLFITLSLSELKFQKTFFLQFLGSCSSLTFSKDKELDDTVTQNAVWGVAHITVVDSFIS